MKRIYEVEFEQKWNTGTEWFADRIKVLANGNAMSAVEKAKKNSLRTQYTDDDGKVSKVIDFRFTAVRVLAEADI